MIIGQKQLVQAIDKHIDNAFPRFSIICGQAGGGKKLLTKYIAKKLGFILVNCENKIDEVRKMISLSYKQRMSTIYAFYDTDSMSVNAKNALLKITEEPPRNAYFVLTLNDLSKTLDTIRSRASIFNLDPYTGEDLYNYIQSNNFKVDQQDKDLILSTCATPGDIDLLLSYNVTDFLDFAYQIVDSLAFVELGNAFKIYAKLKSKEDGWNARLLLETVKYICLTRLQEGGNPAYKECIRICSKYQAQLSMASLNRQMLIDSWIIDLRNELQKVSE